MSLEGVDNARTALAAGKPALVWRQLVADTVTAVGAAERLLRPGRGDFLLESVEGGETWGRYSVLGLDPDLVFRTDGDDAFLNRAWQDNRSAFVPSLVGAIASLRTLSAECRIEVPPALPPALPCLVGYFGYETIALIERIEVPAEDPLRLPDMMFVRASLLLVFDRLRDDLFVIAPLWPGGGAADATIAGAERRVGLAVAALADRPPSPNPAGDAVTPEPNAVMKADAYEALVARAKDEIRAGEIFQVVLSQRFTAPFALPALALYRGLRRVNPSPFLFLIDLPDFAVVGSSPEILVRVRNGVVTVRPIAGTRPRGGDETADEAAHAELLHDPKERAEHLMLLDLGRNDVARVSDRGSVTVTDSFKVERYSHVMHLVSNVTGRLARGLDALDALFAGFPAGTVSGAPKVRACEIIARLETVKRGPYGGGVGYIAPDGSLDSCIVLRTAILKDETMHVQAGAGIVADSDPASEQLECEAKAGALFAAAREAIRMNQEGGQAR